MHAGSVRILHAQQPAFCRQWVHSMRLCMAAGQRGPVLVLPCLHPGSTKCKQAHVAVICSWTWVEVAHAKAELLLHGEAAAGRQHYDAGRPAAAEGWFSMVLVITERLHARPLLMRGPAPVGVLGGERNLPADGKRSAQALQNSCRSQQGLEVVLPLERFIRVRRREGPARTHGTRRPRKAFP